MTCSILTEEYSWIGGFYFEMFRLKSELIKSKVSQWFKVYQALYTGVLLDSSNRRSMI